MTQDSSPNAKDNMSSSTATDKETGMVTSTPRSPSNSQTSTLPSAVPSSIDVESGKRPNATVLAPETGNAPPHPTENAQSTDTTCKAQPAKVSYRDFSHVPPDKPSPASSVLAEATTAKEPTFPVKLHQILSNRQFDEIISWLPHGRSWRILQQKAFEERVIPLFFRHGRYSSFARQVNGWGFRRVTHGSDYNSYYHEMFLRGMPHLCEKMRRLTTKDSAARKNVEDEPAPDFYSISRAHPLPEQAPPTRLATLPEVAHLQRVVELKSTSWPPLDRIVAAKQLGGPVVPNNNSFSALGQAPLLGNGVLGSANPGLSGLENAGLINKNLLAAGAGMVLGSAPTPTTMAAPGTNFAQAGIYNAAAAASGFPLLYGGVIPQPQAAAPAPNSVSASMIANQLQSAAALLPSSVTGGVASNDHIARLIAMSNMNMGATGAVNVGTAGSADKLNIDTGAPGPASSWGMGGADQPPRRDGYGT